MEETKKTVTVKEILTDVCKLLGNIDVPASKIEQIGIPIARAINGIEMCLDAMEREEKEKNSQIGLVDKVEIVPEEEGKDNA